MKISDVMSANPVTIGADQEVAAAAKLMAQSDLGFLPVLENGNLVGAVTDRDIVVRHVAEGNAQSTVAHVMSRDVKTCAPADDVSHVMGQMGSAQVRRIPVVQDGAVVGIFSLADAARETYPATAGATLGEVTQPSGAHSA